MQFFTIVALVLLGTAFLLDVVHGRGQPASYGPVQENCNMKRYLRRGEKFVIESFPPKYDLTGQPYAPRECSWYFKARGNCTLQFETTHYERGDVYCEE